MEQDIYDAVKERATVKGVPTCEWSGDPAPDGQVHHVFGRCSEILETLIWLKPKFHDHKTYKGQLILNRIKEIVTLRLVRKYGEEEARKRAGGKLYFPEVEKTEKKLDKLRK